MRSLLFPILTAATAQFLPADMARSDIGVAQIGEPVIEIVSFRVLDGTSQRDFLAAAAGTDAALRLQPGFVSRKLLQSPDGTWIDLVEWKDLPKAQAAAQAMMEEPSFRPFMAMIDPATVKMSHSALVWRMD